MCNTTFNLEVPLFFDNIVKNNDSQFFKKHKQIQKVLPVACSRKKATNVALFVNI